MMPLRSQCRLRGRWLVGGREVSRGCTASKLEPPKLPWSNAEEGSQRRREAGTLEQIFHLGPACSAGLNPEDRIFTNTLRNKFVGGRAAALKDSISCLPTWARPYTENYNQLSWKT